MPIGMLDAILNYFLGKEIDESELNVQPLDLILAKNPVPIKSVDRPVQVSDHRTKGVNLLVGQGATLAGVAKFFVGLWNPKPDWAKALTPAQYEAIGLELFRFGTEVAFQKKIEPSKETLAQNWATGILLAVPALLEPSGATQQLVVDFQRFETLVKLVIHQDLARVLTESLHDFDPFANPIPYQVVKDKKLKESDLPLPRVVAQHRDDVRSKFVADVPAQSLLWKQRLRWNPYASALPIIHLLDPASGTQDSQREKLIQTIFDPNAISQHELDQISLTSGGLVVLRVAFLTSASLGAVAGLRNRIATALGINATTDLRACNPKFQDPPMDPSLEPPPPLSANLKANRVKGLKFAHSFLGRRVDMTWSSYKQDSGGIWEGPTSAGSIYPDQYFIGPANNDREVLKAVGNKTTPLNDNQLTDRLAIINAIFDIEGYADSIRAMDKALVSVGMQQFSFHVEQEGTILLHRIRGLSDIWFDVFIRSAGFDVGKAPLDANNNKVDVEALTRSEVTINVPEIGRPVASSAGVNDLDKAAWLIRLSADGKQNQWCVPGTVGHKTVKGADGKWLKVRAFPPVSTEMAALHIDCHDAFGFEGNSARPFTEQILTRWAVAARLIPEFIRAQMELCLNRFNQFITSRDAKRIEIKVGDKTELCSLWEVIFQGSTDPAISFEALFPSVAHVAAIIDCFINTPAHAIQPARRAFDRAVDGWSAEPGTPALDVKDSRFRARMLLAYLSERRYYTASASSIRESAQDRWYRRAGTNNVAPDRVVRLLDRLEEKTPSPGFTPRKLRWTDTFHW